MIESYNNIERLRYRLKSDIDELIDTQKDDTLTLHVQIIDTIFASIFSAFVTEVGFAQINIIQPAKEQLGRLGKVLYSAPFIIALKLLLFIIIYIAAFWTYGKLYGLYVEKINGDKVHGSDRSLRKINQRIKDFDNIACDSILASEDYIQLFSELESTEAFNSGDSTEKYLWILYYHELIHCLYTACLKMVELLKDPHCIKTLSNLQGVAIYRIESIYKIMVSINKELVSKQCTMYSFIDSDLSKKCLQRDLSDISNYLVELDKKLKNIIDTTL